ncbi:Dihydropteroate synthase [Myxococcus hansupus]|uniref:Dihydropteroate synthase n=1 Tax=Pseudomyxococcus hansupus TaxID=1297742 RepID=A0A0H4XCD9_9BACT|nr:hypothetical protein [Myxococcus hansupus]AKQ65637.1 Dihydropteroate synthase [Myxococcus hansupus]
MIRARPVTAEDLSDLVLAFRRLGLAAASQAALRESQPHTRLLLTGLGPQEVAFLQSSPPPTALRRLCPYGSPGTSRPGPEPACCPDVPSSFTVGWRLRARRAEG